MNLKLHLGVRTTPGSYKRLTLNDVNLSTKIIDLKVEAGKLTNLPMESLELSYCGNILDDEQTVSECNLQSGITIHVLKKHIAADFSKQIEKMTNTQIKQLNVAFTVIFHSFPAFSNTLQEFMKQPSQIDNLMIRNPALVDDPVAVAILQDPVLLERLSDFATAKRIALQHPALAETANYIAKTVDEEAKKPNTSSTPQSVNYNDANYPYGMEDYMDDYTDEEEMDSSQSSDSAAPPTHGTRGQITSTQLAAALASAAGNLPGLTWGPEPTTHPSSNLQPSTSSAHGGQGSRQWSDMMQGAFSSSSPSAPTTSTSVSPITSDMLQNALARSSSSSSAITPDMLQSALAQSASPAASTLMPPPSLPPLSAFPGHQSLLSQPQQIQQMHDLGLLDDVVNLQALSITGGDVQAAINLVLSGVITGEDEDQ